MKLFILFLAAILPNPRPITEELIENFSSQWSSSQENIVEGLELYQKVDKPLVSFFGGHRVRKTDPQYRAAYMLAKRLAQAGCLIATGGGAGIMEAANCGASSIKDSRTTSISVDIPHQGIVNSCAQQRIFVETYFAKKWLLLETASALVFFPGGIGTLDELAHVLNEIDSNRLKPFPIYVIGKEEWREIQNWIAEGVELGLIAEETATLAIFTDSIKEAEVGILEWIAGHKPTEPKADEQEDDEDY